LFIRDRYRIGGRTRGGWEDTAPKDYRRRASPRKGLAAAAAVRSGVCVRVGTGVRSRRAGDYSSSRVIQMPSEPSTSLRPLIPPARSNVDDAPTPSRLPHARAVKTAPVPAPPDSYSYE
jgi:hypothetical protein